MIISFYNTSSEKNVLNKVLSSGVSMEGAFRDECSVSNPVFIIESESNFSQYNYCYISTFSRYYFIVDIVSYRTNVWELHLHVDVLMSFRDGIVNSDVLLSETNEISASNYLNSDSWVAQVRRNTSVISFESGFTEEGHYVLITAGGV